jgi:hypothetical protein
MTSLAREDLQTLESLGMASLLVRSKIDRTKRYNTPVKLDTLKEKNRELYEASKV